MVAALQKERISEDGARYTRLAHIEAAIELLSALPLHEFVDRARITNRSDPFYVPSECLLHIFRNAGRNQTFSPELEQLFLILRRRVISALPTPMRYAPAISSRRNSRVRPKFKKPSCFASSISFVKIALSTTKTWIFSKSVSIRRLPGSALQHAEKSSDRKSGRSRCFPRKNLPNSPLRRSQRS
jgi:hypothetical protein